MNYTTGEYFPEPTVAENRVSDRDCFFGFNDRDQILRGLMEEIGEKGHEMLKELFDKAEKKNHHHHHHGQIVRALQETLHEFREKPVCEALEKLAGKLNSGVEAEEEEDSEEMKIMDRDLSSEESFRMERFKVKTVNPIGGGGGVVKEEPN